MLHCKYTDNDRIPGVTDEVILDPGFDEIDSMAGGSGHISIHPSFDPMRHPFGKPNLNFPSLQQHQQQQQSAGSPALRPTRRRVTNRFPISISNKNPYRDLDAPSSDVSLPFDPMRQLRPSSFIWTHVQNHAFNPMFAIPLISGSGGSSTNSSSRTIRVKKQRRIKTTTASMPDEE